MKIFREEKHLKPGNDLSKMILTGLENSEYLIFLAERSAADSQWCAEELKYWCNNLNRADKLIIALIDDEIILNQTHTVNFDRSTALPRLLQPYMTSIPLYMDLRWAKTTNDTDLQNPKYRHEINALAARLRGVNPEDLNDEEIRVFRRNIRIRNGAIGILSMMLMVSGGATFWALDAQKKAEENAIEARLQQNNAEKNLTDRIEQETQKEMLNFDRYVNSGDIFNNSGDYKIAIRYYQKADSILQKFPNDPHVLAKRSLLTEKLAKALTKFRLKR
jgi:tetratricopeptide (TPR) repeat protein